MKTKRNNPRKSTASATPNSAAPQTVRQPRELPWQALLAGSLLIAITLLTYAPVVRNQFIWDDDAYITRNPTLRSWEGLQIMWIMPASLPQYYPLVHTTFWIEHRLWGLRPLGYHVDNVVLHAIGVLLVWRLMGRLRLPWPWFIAALFAVHPVSVESVAWATERKNVLSMVLALSSMLCYWRFEPPLASDSRPRSAVARWLWYAASLVLFFGALLSKTVIASLPAVLLVIYWWKRGWLTLRVVLPLVPFLILGGAMGAYTAWLERYHVGAEGSEWAFSPLDRMLIAGRAVWFYAGKLLWPHPIVFFYPRWDIDETAWWQYLFPAAVAGTLISLWLARRALGRGPLAAALIYCGVLMPALGFLNVFPFRFSFVADHFQHHAMLAVLALGVSATAALVNSLSGYFTAAKNQQTVPREGEGQAARPRFNPRIAGRAAAAVVLLALAMISFRQTFTYHDLVTLYEDVIDKNPLAWVAYSNLGVTLSARGQKDRALELFEQALAVDPTKARVNANYAQAIVTVGKRDGFAPGDLEKAVRHFEYSLQIDPNSAETHAGLAEALIELDRVDEAKEHLFRAAELQPHNVRTLLGTGLLMINEKDWEKAAVIFEQLIYIKPSVAEAYHGFGLALLNLNLPQKAITKLEQSLALDPDSYEAHYNLGNALLQVGELHAAAEHYNAALELKPDYLDALSNLGVTLGRLGDAQGAIECFEHIMRIDPTFNGVEINLQKARDLDKHQKEQRSSAVR